MGEAAVVAGLLSPEAERRLRAFRRAVEAALPGQVAEMRLFGSRARGEARSDSDYDVAVFVRAPFDCWDAQTALSDAAYPHVLDGINIRPISLPERYLSPQTSRPALADEVLRDGILLA